MLQHSPAVILCCHSLYCALASFFPPLISSTIPRWNYTHGLIIHHTLPYLHLRFKLIPANTYLAFLPNFSKTFLKPYFYRYCLQQFFYCDLCSIHFFYSREYLLRFPVLCQDKKSFVNSSHDILETAVFFISIFNNFKYIPSCFFQS